MTDEALTRALARIEAGLAAMRMGDPAPYRDCWANIEEATLFGAWGPIEKGFGAIGTTFEWVGSRFKGGDLELEYAIVHSSGDLAYTVGFERGEVSVDGGQRRPMTIRVTHVLRRIDGEWKLVHRHADFPPPDERG